MEKLIAIFTRVGFSFISLSSAFQSLDLEGMVDNMAQRLDYYLVVNTDCISRLVSLVDIRLVKLLSN